MAELEAVYYNPDPKAADVSRAGWRKELPLDRPVTLGRVPELAEWAMEEDPSISRVNATLVWDGRALRVTAPTGRATSPIYHGDKPSADFAVAVGESFGIGTTRFTLCAGGESPAANPAKSSQVVAAEATVARAVLRESPFDNAEVVLRALEELPDVLRLVTATDRLLQRLVDILLKAIPAAGAAAVVRLAPESTPTDRRVELKTHKQRGAAYDGDFFPARGLVYKAVRVEKKSVLWVWAPGSSADMTARALPGIPWAICTPLRDGSGVGLYVEGSLHREPVTAGGRVTDRELTGYQKVAELVASIIEASRKSHTLERWLAVYQSYLPSTVRSVPDPDRLKQLLTPREAVVTVMFCDLRGSCRLVEAGEATLLSTWEKVADALDDMAAKVTEHGGVVAGFQGDAVLAFWGWPEDQPDQIDRAVKAALRIRERFAKSGWWEDLSCGVGLAHGPAVVGALGTHDLAKIDVFGPVVNLASRLEGLTKTFGVRVIADAAVAERLTERMARTRRLAKVVPAGMTQPQEVYELLPAGADLSGGTQEALRQFWEQAADRFAAGEWSAARAALEDYFADDPAAGVLIEYMKRHGNRVPADWNGTITLTAK